MKVWVHTLNKLAERKTQIFNLLTYYYKLSELKILLQQVDLLFEGANIYYSVSEVSQWSTSYGSVMNSDRASS